MLLRFVRHTSTTPSSYFKLFPKSFPNGSSFKVNPKTLRNEYRKLQSKYHPDLIDSTEGGDEDKSTLINKAYETLGDPLKRSQYILLFNSGIDLNDETISKSLQFKDKSLFLEIMEIHENLESITNETELVKMKEENESSIKNVIAELEKLIESKDWDGVALNTVKLKYYYNIKKSLKDWQIGKDIMLNH